MTEVVDCGPVVNICFTQVKKIPWSTRKSQLYSNPTLAHFSEVSSYSHLSVLSDKGSEPIFGWASSCFRYTCLSWRTASAGSTCYVWKVLTNSDCFDGVFINLNKGVLEWELMDNSKSWHWKLYSKIGSTMFGVVVIFSFDAAISWKEITESISSNLQTKPP